MIFGVKSIINFIQHSKILLTVFITGAAVLVIEVAAVRILSPYFGNTLYSFSSVLSTVLGALSLGYYYGGRWADKNPSEKNFYRIILYSGVSVLVLHILSILVLPLLGFAFSLIWGPLISAFILFFVPSFLLGTLSPYAIRLQSEGKDPHTIGRISGEVFFWSTIGSIGGSLISGFFLIPQFGTDTIILSLALFLVVLGVLGTGWAHISRKSVETVGFLIIMVLVAAFLMGRELDAKYLVLKDGLYSRISIHDGTYIGKPTRFFFQDASAAGAMDLQSGGLAYEYTKYYDAYRVFNSNVKRALVIGGGIYSVPKELLEDIPDVSVDVSEIEPGLYDLAKEYFGLEDDPRLKNYIVDGRRFLHDTPHTYDFIFTDAYKSLYSVPVHLTTKEFFELAKEKLSPGGVFMANVIGSLSPEAPSFTLSEMKTWKSVFPNSYFFGTKGATSHDPQNLIFVAVNSDTVFDLGAPHILKDKNPIIRGLNEKLVDMNAIDFSPHIVFTDRYAPVEHYSANFFKKIAKERRGDN